MSLVAGTGVVCPTEAPAGCYTGDGGQAINATLNEPHGVAVDSENNVYIADSKNCVIRKVDPSGIISTYAGTGQRNPANTKACAKTDGTPDGPALTIALDQPKSLFMTRVSGVDLFNVADMGNNQIRMIDVDGAAPVNKRVAGTLSRNYGVGAGFDAKDSDFRRPESMWVANDGTMYVSDGGDDLIRKTAAAPTPNGIRKVSVIAGDAAGRPGRRVRRPLRLWTAAATVTVAEAINAHPRQAPGYHRRQRRQPLRGRRARLPYPPDQPEQRSDQHDRR